MQQRLPDILEHEEIATALGPQPWPRLPVPKNEQSMPLRPRLERTPRLTSMRPDLSTLEADCLRSLESLRDAVELDWPGALCEEPQMIEVLLAFTQITVGARYWADLQSLWPACERAMRQLFAWQAERERRFAEAQRGQLMAAMEAACSPRLGSRVAECVALMAGDKLDRIVRAGAEAAAPSGVLAAIEVEVRGGLARAQGQGRWQGELPAIDWQAVERWFAEARANTSFVRLLACLGYEAIRAEVQAATSN